MQLTKFEKYIEEAASVALKSPMTWKYACVIVNGNKIISTGHNKYARRTQLSDVFSLHAEMDALSNVRNTKELRGSTVIVVRVNISPELPYTYLQAVPCHNCEVRLRKWQRKYGIKDVLYTTDVNLGFKYIEENCKIQ